MERLALVMTADLRAALAAAEAVSAFEPLGSGPGSSLPALAAAPVATPLEAPHLAHLAWLSAAWRRALMPACLFSHAMLASCSVTQGSVNDWKVDRRLCHGHDLVYTMAGMQHA